MRQYYKSGVALWRRMGIGLLLALIWALAYGGPESAAPPIAIIYPELDEPYRSIFSEIIAGIEEQAQAPVRRYPMGSNLSGADLSAQLQRNGTKVVIALGRQGLKAASGLERNLAVVVGGVFSAPEVDRRNLMIISLTPAPALLFARLKTLFPGVKKIIVIYNPQYNEWLLSLAREAAQAEGLELVAREARDQATAARLYEATFATVDNRHDAIWLPQDATTVDESTILPLVLKEAWRRGVPVFSSSLLHVKKGVLFALYPDNRVLGHTLANAARDILTGRARQGMLPLRAVLTAVNLRTASHLGANISYQQQGSFDAVFPEP